MAFFNTLRTLLTHPLNQADKPAALTRYLRWQFGIRLVSNPVVIDFANGSRLIARHGVSSVIESYYSGLNEFEDMSFLLHFLRPDDLFFDIGANVGSFTVLASAAVGARSVSFEPVPGVFEQLRDNINLNRIGDRVTAMNTCLGQTSRRLHFTSHMEAGNHVATEQDLSRGDTIEVDVVPLDDVVNGHPPTLMKVDVEGFETDVFAGATDTLANPGLLALIIETNGSGARYGYDELALHQKIIDQEFTAVSYDPFERRLTPRAGINTKGNTLYVREPGQAATRLENAPTFTVNQRTL